MVEKLISRSNAHFEAAIEQRFEDGSWIRSGRQVWHLVIELHRFLGLLRSIKNGAEPPATRNLFHVHNRSASASQSAPPGAIATLKAQMASKEELPRVLEVRRFATAREEEV